MNDFCYQLGDIVYNSYDLNTLDHMNVYKIISYYVDCNQHDCVMYECVNIKTGEIITLNEGHFLLYDKKDFNESFKILERKALLVFKKAFFMKKALENFENEVYYQGFTTVSYPKQNLLNRVYHLVDDCHEFLGENLGCLYNETK